MITSECIYLEMKRPMFVTLETQSKNEDKEGPMERRTSALFLTLTSQNRLRQSDQHLKPWNISVERRTSRRGRIIAKSVKERVRYQDLGIRIRTSSRFEPDAAAAVLSHGSAAATATTATASPVECLDGVWLSLIWELNSLSPCPGFTVGRRPSQIHVCHKLPQKAFRENGHCNRIPVQTR